MSLIYRHLLRPCLFLQNSEEAHDRTMKLLAWAGRRKPVCNALGVFFRPPEIPVRLFGLDFPNPVGLAAGMDKHAVAVPVWEALGFGFAELGGVTWHAQPGNPAPRMFRAVPDEALINRMGFNSAGAEAMAVNLASWKQSGLWPRHPIGINLGKSKITPLEKASEDYADSFRVLRDYADFFVVNVSSPNTPNLRQLQDKPALAGIFAALRELNNGRKPETGGQAVKRPILVKVAPDLSFEALDEILELTGPSEIAGIVATNTTISRPEAGGEQVRRIYSETGGLSGRPLRGRSTEVIRHLYRQTKGALPIIGVGGIFNAEDAWEKITAGASLVQVYTGLVYEGPSIARRIVNGLRQRLDAAGNPTWSELVGSASRP
jgi:dihydroorotate dehydrogenase